MNLVRSFCFGDPLFGNPDWPVVKCKVLFVEPEVRWTMRERMNFVFYGKPEWVADPTIPDPLPFDYLWPPPGFNLRLHDYREWFKDQIVAGGYDVVILDSIGRIATYNESDNSEVAAFLNEMRYIQGDHAAIVWTQHFGKPPIDMTNCDPLDFNRIRGASKWSNDIDLILTLMRKPGALTADLDHQSWMNKMRWAKVRHLDIQSPDCEIAFNLAKDGKMLHAGAPKRSTGGSKGKIFF